MTMPALFIGHGNPMNAITDNPFRKSWLELGAALPHPRAILCISAHWLSRGTFVTMADPPRTIHDFGGFPEELYAQQYPAPGAPDIARLTIETILKIRVQPDQEWGLGTGTSSTTRTGSIPQNRSPGNRKALRVRKWLSKGMRLVTVTSCAMTSQGVLTRSPRAIVWNTS